MVGGRQELLTATPHPCDVLGEAGLPGTGRPTLPASRAPWGLLSTEQGPARSADISIRGQDLDTPQWETTTARKGASPRLPAQNLLHLAA